MKIAIKRAQSPNLFGFAEREQFAGQSRKIAIKRVQSPSLIEALSNVSNLRDEGAKSKFAVILILCSMLFCRCEKAPDWSEGKQSDSLAPNPVTDVTVENLPGGVKIKYTLPDEDDLLGVKAVYSYTSESAALESYSSAFTDSILITGFPNTDERVVRLISIDKSLNESEPVNVTIKPGTPPVNLIFQSLEIYPTFGGVMAKWENEANAEVGISLYAADANGDMNLDYTYFTDRSGIYSFRGFDDTERQFSIQVRDRWDNYSDIKTLTLKPLYEVEIFGKNASGLPVWSRYGYDDGSVKWRGDAAKNDAASNLQFSAVFDGLMDASHFWHQGRPGNTLKDYTGVAADESISLVPIYFTIDLGKSCKLSRHKEWQRSDTPLRDNNLKSYEIWATNELPKGPGDFGSQMESLAYWTSWSEVNGTDQWKQDWVKIADCEIIPPSGATNLTDVTAADRTWALANGFEFDINPEYTSQSFRYLRFVCQKNWAGGTIIHIGELQFWGAYDE